MQCHSVGVDANFARIVWLSAAVACLLAPSSALADLASPRPTPSSAPERAADERTAATARRLVLRAQRAANAGDLDGAIRDYREAWRLAPSYEVACNIGNLEESGHNAIEAARFLTRCVELAPATLDEDERRRQADDRAKLQKVKGELGTIRVQAPEGALVLVGESSAGRAPLIDPIFVRPGFYRVQAYVDNRRAEARVTVGAGEERFVNLALEAPFPPPLPPPPPVPLVPVISVPKPAPLARPILIARSEARWWPIVVGSSLFTVGTGLVIGFQVAADTAERERDELRITILSDIDIGHHCGEEDHKFCAHMNAAEARRVDFHNAAMGMGIATAIAAAGTIGFAVYEINRMSFAPTISGLSLRYVW